MGEKVPSYVQQELDDDLPGAVLKVKVEQEVKVEDVEIAEHLVGHNSKSKWHICQSSNLLILLDL